MRTIGVLVSGVILAAAAACGSRDVSADGASAEGGAGGDDGGSTRDASMGTDGSGTPGEGGAAHGADGGTFADGGAIPKGTKMADFLGVNANIADEPAMLGPIGTVREYHNWGWIADNYASAPAFPDMLYTFMNFNGWDWDKYYSEIEAAGGSAFPAVQGGVPWLSGGAIPPSAPNEDKTHADAYKAHGDAMFQIAARYGRTKVPDAKLKLKATQTRVSGLGLVSYFEDFNEQDNAAAFTGDAFAAMASADYDGDQTRLGDTIGVKNADPNAKLVMGGLSGKYPTGNGRWVTSITDYLDAMRAWATTNRGGDFPADVLNVHYYSFATSQGAAAPSPEDDMVKEKLAAIVAYRDQQLPGKELWWTEFGYDTFPTSPLHAPAIGGNSAEIVQGQWLVRDFLAAAAAGIDRATLFEFRDTCTPPAAACNTQFATAGIGLVSSPFTPKASWYFLATFRARLTRMVYVGEQASGNADVLVYKFKDTAGPGGALVAWAKTSAAKILPAYAITLPPAARAASAITLVDKQQNGTETPLTPTAGNVTITISETPTILIVDAM